MATTTSLARSLGRAALDLLFPPRCAVCGAAGAFLCAGCASALVEASPPRCPRCWRPGPDAGECFDCRLAPPAFDALRAGFVYQGVAREVVHALKYRGMTVLAAPMASLLTGAAARESFDVVVPVPLSGLRKRTRGYNQAELLARALAEELGVLVEPRALVRKRHTPPQARSADAEARRRNVAGAFACRDASLAGRRVLLVDDVTTTGATLAACAGALKAAGAASVRALAFARED
ncbi:MAG: ComF family protein [Dehalococcoidia bacterium]